MVAKQLAEGGGPKKVQEANCSDWWSSAATSAGDGLEGSGDKLNRSNHSTRRKMRRLVEEAAVAGPWIWGNGENRVFVSDDGCRQS